MKDNYGILHGGKLLEQYKPVWAKYHVKFIEEYEKRDIPVRGLSVQKEPMAVQIWESCVYTAEEERDFIKKYPGPTLENDAFPNMKLLFTGGCYERFDLYRVDDWSLLEIYKRRCKENCSFIKPNPFAGKGFC
ncbi:MAG: hypothetical protein ACK2TU_04115 [Anaerolineales bacterium]